MPNYTGIDLHSNNCFLAVMDQQGKRVLGKRTPNDPDLIFQLLAPFQKDMAAVTVESTYNWYWLADFLMDAGFSVHLANPAAIQQYKGLKHSGDSHDAFWLADMLRLDILPTGYIYPRETRPVRDLLRKRGHLVRIRTSLINSLRNIVHRNTGGRISGNDVKSLKEDRVSHFLDHNEDLAMAGDACKETIDFLGQRIRRMEVFIEKKLKLEGTYQHLVTLPGVGRVLGLTIMLETGPVERFPAVGNYVSYCRKVSTQWTSNGKTKGRGNKKNGNRYLAWAFSEAAEGARRHDPMSRAAYHIMKDGADFAPERMFG
ncbi:MAG: IS110 family transposase [Deltaproteobacteria bacterium]|nr:IS110 family transposase [Deltaproteobacteria bacterium]